jgi:hypothetical protein
MGLYIKITEIKSISKQWWCLWTRKMGFTMSCFINE